MQKFNNILLFGGETKNENMPVGFYSSLAMLPLRGKPVIWWQFQNLKEQGLDDFILVVCQDNKKLLEYAKVVLCEQFKIKLVQVNSKKNILSSLKYGLQVAALELPTRVILGDTMLTQSIDDITDVLFTSKKISTSENWCLVEKLENSNLYFHDKKKNVPLSDKEALVGYYSFADTKHILNCCVKSRLLFKKEISTALIAYQEKYPLKTKLVDDWFDLGHTSGLIKAKNNLFSARSFNSISVDTETGLLTKTSTKVQKLEDEAFWYLNLPEDLKIYTPRFISFNKNEKSAELTQELYGYPSLQELYLSGEVNLEDWRYIIEKLFKLHKNFEKYSIDRNDEALLWLYFDKTKERINELKQQNLYWQGVLERKFEFINGKKVRGLIVIKIPKIIIHIKQVRILLLLIINIVMVGTLCQNLNSIQKMILLNYSVIQLLILYFIPVLQNLICHLL
ncbi:MAG: hypothetical protein LUG16_06365 [Candidatus Gastranaerophilales bacterium]|nr:hypothetical protein [Candidatus Gastranaerophilales bacterium]